MAALAPDELQREGEAILRWIAAHWKSLQERPVASQRAPGQTLEQLPCAPPEKGESWRDILADLDRVVAPGLTLWQHPSFFGYFPANASTPAVLADLLCAGLAVQGMLWSTSPACTELEMRMLDWLAHLLGLPEAFTFHSDDGGGVIQGTASEAVLVAMVAARHRAHAQRDSGPDLSRLRAYCSSQAHSSVLKAATIAGLAPEQVRLIGVDPQLRMQPEALAQAVAEDQAAGLRPFFVCATLGTTASGAVDPLEPIGAVAKRVGAWLHVDAAWAGAACVCPEHRAMLAGVEQADSFTTNPHKWLLTNFDCSALWVRNRRALTEALSITPEYLRNPASESGCVVDYRDWQIPLGRRFRALKLWFVIRRFGAEGLRAHIRRHTALAEQLESWIRRDARFELAAPRSLALLCLRLADDDDAGTRSRRLLERVNASGKAFLTHAALPTFDEQGQATGHARFVIRVAIGGSLTQAQHVEQLWSLLTELAAQV
ncbi:MAG: aminotransferase class V-fold PLP-dependent enzyme [Planctomycetota bacterium]|nr:MAG: aminotransferase class V-fold PLP-dependent enzyme [Planctomycetota bacterium]